MIAGMINQSLSMQQVAHELSTARHAMFRIQRCNSNKVPTVHIGYNRNYSFENYVTIEKLNKQLDIFEGYHDLDGYPSMGNQIVPAFQKIWDNVSYPWKEAKKHRWIDLINRSEDQLKAVSLSNITTPEQHKDVLEKLTGLLEAPDSLFEIPYLLYPEDDHSVKTPSKKLIRFFDTTDSDKIPYSNVSAYIVYKDTDGKETKAIVRNYTEIVTIEIEGEDANQIPGYLRLLTEKNESFSTKYFSWHAANRELDMEECRRLDIIKNKSLTESPKSRTNSVDNSCYELVLKYLRQE